MRYRYRLRDGGSVGYYIDEAPAGADEDYMTAMISADDTPLAGELRERGFHFAERSIPMEIPLRDLRPPVKPGRKYSLLADLSWDPEELFQIASPHFDTDTRFAVAGPETRKAQKDELLLAYIAQLRAQDCCATRLYSEAGLEGFNIWKIKEAGGGACI